MSVIELERPAAPAPAPRDWFTWTDIGLRAVLLSLLIAAGVSVLPAHLASERTSADFLRDVSAHRVTSGDYKESARELRWADGWRHWHYARLGEGRVPLPALAANAPRLEDQTFPDDPQAEADMTWANQALLSSHSSVSVGQITGNAHDNWWVDVPSSGLSLCAGIAALLGFALMLGRDKRRFVSRWGWFWIIVLGGVWGIAAFLVLEPMPLWWRSWQDRPMPAAPPVLGGRGFLIGLVVKAGPLLVLSFLAKMISQLLPT
jgi:hypothetical protein